GIVGYRQVAACAQLFECTDDSQGCTPQAVGITLTGWEQADTPDTYQCFGSLGDEEDGADECVIVDRLLKTYAVLVSQGVDLAWVGTVSVGVGASHDALQLGTLKDDIGYLVGFGQSRGAVREVGIGLEPSSQIARNGPGALCALLLCA